VPDFLASELFFVAGLIERINQAKDSELVATADNAEDANECIDTELSRRCHGTHIKTHRCLRERNTNIDLSQSKSHTSDLALMD
jgi:hypothetical protein